MKQSHGAPSMQEVNPISLSKSGKNKWSGTEFNEFEPRRKSAKNQFQLSAGLNLEKLLTILSGTNHIWAASLI